MISSLFGTVLCIFSLLLIFFSIFVAGPWYYYIVALLCGYIGFKVVMRKE